MPGKLSSPELCRLTPSSEGNSKQPDEQEYILVESHFSLNLKRTLRLPNRIYKSILCSHQGAHVVCLKSIREKNGSEVDWPHDRPQCLVIFKRRLAGRLVLSIRGWRHLIHSVTSHLLTYLTPHAV